MIPVLPFFAATTAKQARQKLGEALGAKHNG